MTGPSQRDGTTMRVGILGAGQLGQMLALAGIPLGMRFDFFSPTPSASAAAVGNVIIGEYDDIAALREFARNVDVVTYEFENVSSDAVAEIEQMCPVWPPRSALVTSQDRGFEKQEFARLGIPIAPYRLIDSLADLESAIRDVGVPGILKTRRFGYDGKGQVRLTARSDAESAWNALGPVPLIYEGLVQFERELSVIAVRSADGKTLCYPVAENHHRDGILRTSFAPADRLSDAKRHQAESYARALLAAFGYVGVFAIEMFDTPSGLVANEMAPRVHNSGHWTIEGAETSQFENHVRAVCNLPLGECAPVGYSAMFNLIAEHPDTASVLAIPDTHLHLYGKSERSGRKLGHVTIRSRTREDLQRHVASLRAIPRIV
ncbi:MAG TPA: 5-(carboxyamino)imidazole ribonucleotide synthase [Gemmatimonadaceae bacterium]|nr:5-(carboxyamino)imidazole ribonucleotide synthase [Gemmatimonadaceae bacterium]